MSSTGIHCAPAQHDDIIQFMTNNDGFSEEPQTTSIASSQEETQLRKHKADRRYERRTVLLATTLAALVALTVAGASSHGLASSVRDADRRDNRTFWRQQEAASIHAWLQAAGALDRAEITAVTPAEPGTTVTSSVGTDLDMQTDLLRLGEETDALQLFASPETYRAAVYVATLQSDVLNILRDSKCSIITNGKLPAGCSKLPTIEEIYKAQQKVLQLAQADLNKPNGPK